MATARSSRWEDAFIAAAILAVDPTGIGGISVRSAIGPVRDRWLGHCRRLFPRRCGWQRVPANVGDDRLLGGLDLAATLRAGRPVVEQGILAQADGGVVLLSMAERVSAGTAAKIGCVLDRGEVAVERDGFGRRARSRFAVIALDEGIEADERPPDSLLERLGLHVDLNGVPVSETADGDVVDYDITRARRVLSDVRVAEELLVALCEVSAAFGVTSARAAWFALRVARALCALDDRLDVSEDDVALAARLVFAPRAITAPGDPPHDCADPAGETAANASADAAAAAAAAAKAAADAATAADAETAAAKAAAEAAANDATADPSADADAAANADANRANTAAGADANGTNSGTGAGDSSAHPGTPRPSGSAAERVLAAAKACLPPNFLSQLQPHQARASGSRQAGRTGGEHISQSRGRPTGSRAGELRPGARINLIETLRAAAPWQRLRRLAAERAEAAAHTDILPLNRAAGSPATSGSAPLGASSANPIASASGAPDLRPRKTSATSSSASKAAARPSVASKPAAPGSAAGKSTATLSAVPNPALLIRVHKDDIRLIRFLRRNRSTTIFLVDASGSSALNRLAEVKGAVELMLAESYVRRDRVALISFRGAAAQILLPPTNSLVRAKRELARLPGGGGTPLAIGIDTARALADSLKRRGESPMVVVLTDGRPNITRDGKGNRVRAEADAVSAARLMRTNSIASLMVDTAPQPRTTTAQFAREMGATYVPLPYADAGALASLVGRAAQANTAWPAATGARASDRRAHV